MDLAREGGVRVLGWGRMGDGFGPSPHLRRTAARPGWAGHLSQVRATKAELFCKTFEEAHEKLVLTCLFQTSTS